MRDAEYRAEYWDGDDEPRGIAAVWDLSWGCSISVGRDADGPDLFVTVNVADEAQRRGVEKRRITAEQMRQFGQMLIESADKHDRGELP